MNIMRLLEIEQKYTLYVDMDGVLVDFNKAVLNLIGQPMGPDTKKLFWRSVKNMGGKELIEFWSNMDWTRQGRELWSYVSKYSPQILSSSGSSMRGQIEQGKTKWIEKHLTPNPTNIIYELNKEKYAHPSAIIIDDRSKVIDPWIAAGGIGILHVDGRLDNTIAQLDKYLQ